MKFKKVHSFEVQIIFSLIGKSGSLIQHNIQIQGEESDRRQVLIHFSEICEIELNALQDFQPLLVGVILAIVYHDRRFPTNEAFSKYVVTKPWISRKDEISASGRTMNEDVIAKNEHFIPKESVLEISAVDYVSIPIRMFAPLAGNQNLDLPTFLQS